MMMMSIVRMLEEKKRLLLEKPWLVDGGGSGIGRFFQFVFVDVVMRMLSLSNY